ncbi:MULTISPECIES: GtrA family protein [Clostridia]|uniref:GtrA family protein n=2 Tax=Clostridia TaxID=186801 RepID=A0A8I0AAS4_9CLOT|nr:MULTISPECIES: GtrA family protein [Clostridia]MBC5639019.1 GtrA family protein [Clostridium lentum]MBC5653112.1 GtrA family protein [Blautia lenta]
MKFINDGVIRFVKFGMVGVINTLVNWIIFFILNALGMYYILANIIAYILGTVNSYLWNTLWVFKYKDKASTETTIKFIILNLIGLGLNTGILYVLVDLCNLNKFIGLVITTAIVMIINYIVNKLWVFSK